jgi:hypothetical protein
MLTAEQKRAIEMQAAQAIRRSWGGLNGMRARGIIDDIRAKVIEDGWFGKPVADQLNDARFLGYEPDKAGLGRLYEMGTEKLEAAREAVFGRDERERNEPEVER